jgi:CHAD domain-containing protein
VPHTAKTRGWELPAKLAPQTLLRVLPTELEGVLSRARCTVWHLLDDYDWSLWQAGCLALLSDRELLVVRREGEGLSLADGKCRVTPVLPADLPVGKLADAVRAITQRPLLDRARVVCCSRELRVVNDQGKLVADGRTERWRMPDRRQLAWGVWLRALRGYEPEGEKLYAAFAEVAECRAKGSLLLPPVRSGAVGTFQPDVPDLRMALDTSLPADQAVGERLGSLLAASWRNEEGIVADVDPECLHHYRVGLRRARVLVTHANSVLGSETAQQLARHLRELGQRTGPLRDLDVQLADCAWYESLLAEDERAGLVGFRELLVDRRRRAQQSLRRYLRCQSYARRRETVDRLLGVPAQDPEPVPAFLRRALWHRFRRWRKLCRKLGDAPTDTGLHRLRIEAKKLRYLFEFAGGLFAESQIGKWLPLLKGLQDALGRAHDLAVCSAWVDEYARSLAGGQDSEAASCASLAKALAGLHAESREAAIREIGTFTRKRGRKFLALIDSRGKTP